MSRKTASGSKVRPDAHHDDDNGPPSKRMAVDSNVTEDNSVKIEVLDDSQDNSVKIKVLDDSEDSVESFTLPSAVPVKMEATRIEMDNSVGESAAITANIIVAKTESPKTKAELEESTVTDDNLLTKYNELLKHSVTVTEENKELRKENIALLKEASAITEENKALLKENLALTKEASAVTEENVTLLKENIVLTKEASAVTEENKTLLKENLALTKEASAILKENSALMNDVKAHLTERVALSNEKVALLRENTAYLNEIRALSFEKGELLDENAALNANLAFLREVIVVIRSSIVVPAASSDADSDVDSNFADLDD